MLDENEFKAQVPSSYKVSDDEKSCSMNLNLFSRKDEIELVLIEVPKNVNSNENSLTKASSKS